MIVYTQQIYSLHYTLTFAVVKHTSLLNWPLFIGIVKCVFNQTI